MKKVTESLRNLADEIEKDEYKPTTEKGKELDDCIRVLKAHGFSLGHVLAILESGICS